jgi:heat shock protein HslJ
VNVAKRHLLATCLAVALLLLALVPVAAQDERPDGTWGVIAYDPWGEGLQSPLPGSTLTVSLLQESSLEGQTGCGRYDGGYYLEDEQLRIGMAAKGFIGCPEPQTGEAVAFSVALDAVATWRASEIGLELLDEFGTVRLVLGRSSTADPLGDWIVQRYVRPSGKPASPSPELPMLLRLEAEGSASGSTGCRLFEGLFVLDGERLTFGPIERTGLPCEGDGRRPERQLLAALAEVALWSRDGDRLTLADAFGELRLELQLDPSTPPEPAQSPAPSPSGSPPAAPEAEA